MSGLLSDKQLDDIISSLDLPAYAQDPSEAGRELRAHIDAQAAQIERYRDMIVALTSGRDWDDDHPRTVAPEAERTLDKLLGFEVQA